LNGERYLFDGALAGLYLSGFPSLTSLSFGGNIVKILEIVRGENGKWGLIDTLSVYDNPPSMDYFSDPLHIHKHVVVRKGKIIVNPPPGDLYFPLVTNRPLWVSMSVLEPFPTLPIEITIQTTAGLKVRSTPNINGINNVRVLRYGEKAIVIDYKVIASSVWGKISDAEWICLCYYPALGYGPYYFTSWKMDAQPPIPPGN
jgi:hypothetical protein